jgi:hypothetical protein
LIHNPHESARGVGEPKWHEKPFKKPIMLLERGFPFILEADTYLVILTMKINLGKKMVAPCNTTSISSRRGMGK